MQKSSRTPPARIQSENIRSSGFGEVSAQRQSRRPTPNVSPARFSSISSSSTVGNLPRGPAVSSVLLPASKAAYVPNLRPIPKLQTRSTPAPQQQDPRWRKTILTRFLLEDGTITFALGTNFGGTIIRDSDEISLDRILDYVTPAELERFETEEFIKEDEQEEEAKRLAAIRKPKGRPVGWRAEMGLTYAQFVQMNGGATQATEKIVKKRQEEPARHLNQGKSFKQGRPSFNGPKPLQDSLRDEGSSSVTGPSTTPSGMMAIRGRPRGRPRVYSLVAAAGLGPDVSSQDETSREITPAPVASVSVDIGGPPSKRKRLTQPGGKSGKLLSSDIELDSQVITELGANQKALGKGTQPKVIIPTITRVNNPSKKREREHEYSTRRRCQRCKKRRQSCDGAHPCERCYKAGIDAAGCISEDEVRVTNSTKRPASTTANVVSTKASSDEKLPTLNKQFPHASTLRRSGSEESSNSWILGPSITVEANNPAALVGPTEPPSTLNPSEAAFSAVPSTTPQKPTSRPKSLTPHYPINSQLKKAKPSPTRSGKELKTAAATGDDKGLDNNSPSRKRKYSPESSHNDTSQPVSSAVSVGQDTTSNIFNPFRTVRQYLMKRGPSDGDKALDARQPASSSRSTSSEQTALMDVHLNRASPTTQLQPSAEDSFLRAGHAVSGHIFHSPETITAQTTSSMENLQQDAAPTQNDDGHNIDGEDSDASSSASSVLPHGTIVVEPRYRRSKTISPPALASAVGNPPRRPASEANPDAELIDEDLESTQRSLALRFPPPDEER